MDVLAPLIGMAIPLMVMAFILLWVSRNIIRVPPDQAVVLAGRKRYVVDPATGERQIVGYRVIRGGSAFQIPVLERADHLHLAEMSIRLDLEGLRDRSGLATSVSVLVNCRVASEGSAMGRAITRFLTMDLPDVEQIVRTTIESRIMDLFPSIEAADATSWPEDALILETAIRSDLDALGISVDSVIFRGPPTVSAAPVAVNGHGANRSE